MQIFKRFLPLFAVVFAVLSACLFFAPHSPAHANPSFIHQPQVGVLLVTDTTDISPFSIAVPTLSSPVNGANATTTRPTFNWSDVTGAISYTLRITGENSFSGLSAQAATVDITATTSIYTPTQALPNSVYTWTVQAHNAAGEVSGYAAPFTFTLQITRQVFLPIIIVNPQPVCPTTSSAGFNIIPIEGNRTDRPDYLHGDLNLSLRGYSITNEPKTLQDYGGGIGSDPPQLAGLVEPNSFTGISTVYRVNSWDWGCGGHGCVGGPITDWPVTMMGLVTASGQKIYIPERNAEIYGGGYKVMVLYAEENRITLGYTRNDSVAPGYSVHLENICVDSNLLALYREQVGPDGLRIFKNGFYWLPALKNNQALGTALNGEILVAIRDKGAFMDPRSQKDWWK